MPIEGVTLEGVEGLQAMLDRLSRKLVPTVKTAFAEWFLGNDRRGLKHYPGYEYVSREEAYPEVGGFFSDAQRKYVMAKIRSGEMTPGSPQRTGAIANGWRMEGGGSDYVQLVNDAPGVEYVMGDGTQARQPRRAGWRTISEIIGTNIAGATRHAVAAIRALIRNQSVAESDEE
jgi:hypothetical protein